MGLVSMPPELHVLKIIIEFLKRKLVKLLPDEGTKVRERKLTIGIPKHVYHAVSLDPRTKRNMLLTDEDVKFSWEYIGKVELTMLLKRH